MNLGLNSPNEAAFGAAGDFSVVIACEDSATAPSACEVLELLEQNLKDEGRLTYRWWNFELLACTAFHEMAAADAATADTIIIVIHAGRELPQEVTAWMNLWLPLRKNRPGALLAVLNSDLNQPDASPEILAQLKRVAALGHMDFFATRAMEVGRDAEVARRAGEVVRQFVMARKNGVQNGLPGGGAGGNDLRMKQNNQIRL